MITILCYPLLPIDKQQIEIPNGAVFLTVMRRGCTICLWYIVDTDRSKHTRRFYIKEVGHPIQDGECGVYLGSCHRENSCLVWHVFTDA